LYHIARLNLFQRVKLNTVEHFQESICMDAESIYKTDDSVRVCVFLASKNESGILEVSHSIVQIMKPMENIPGCEFVPNRKSHDINIVRLV